MTSEKKSQARFILLTTLAVWLIATAITVALSTLYLRLPDRQYIFGRALFTGFFLALPALFFAYFSIKSLNTGHSVWERGISLLAALLMLLVIGFLCKVGLDASKTYASAVCYANLGQVGLGLLMYADDYDDRLPPADSWLDATLPYTKNIKAYKCPADLSAARCSYALNTNLSGKVLKEIKHPERVVLLYDTDKPGLNPSGGKEYFPAKGRHRGQIRLVFVDGHVDSYNPKTKSPPLEWK
jgi:hypothetical protein